MIYLHEELIKNGEANLHVLRASICIYILKASKDVIGTLDVSLIEDKNQVTNNSIMSQYIKNAKKML